MKIISLLQPWATLVVIAAKRIETRSFDTRHRGPLLIHASQKQSAAAKEIHTTAHRDFELPQLPLFFEQLPFGAIIGQVSVDGTAKTEFYTDCRKAGMPIINGSPLTEWDQELAFGDYSPGRFGWLLTDAVQFAHPIPAKGQLQMWNYDMPDHVHIPTPHGGHATFTTPPTKELLAAVNTMAELAYDKLRKGELQ